MKQSTFASLSFETKKKRTRREVFLGEIDLFLLVISRRSYPCGEPSANVNAPAGPVQHEAAAGAAGHPARGIDHGRHYLAFLVLSRRAASAAYCANRGRIECLAEPLVRARSGPERSPTHRGRAVAAMGRSRASGAHWRARCSA
jgi:hypothetical protein